MGLHRQLIEAGKLEPDSDHERRWCHSGEGAVVIAPAVTDPIAPAVEAHQRHHENVGNHDLLSLRNSGTETTFTQLRCRS
jgi:hypothetical protein